MNLVWHVWAVTVFLTKALSPAQSQEPPDRPEADLKAIRSLLEARDEALTRFDCRFRIWKTYKTSPEESLYLEGWVVRSGFKRRLEAKFPTEEREEIATWDGEVFYHSNFNWKDASKNTVQKGTQPTGIFESGQYPHSFGLSVLGKPLSQFFAGRHQIEIQGREILEDASCLVIFLHPRASGQHPGPWPWVLRMWLDEGRTLLAKRLELLNPLPEGASSPKEVRLGNRRLAPSISWTVTEEKEIDGIWFPVAGIEDFDGDPTGKVDFLRIEVDPASIRIGTDYPEELFRLEIPRGSHVYDQATGTLSLFGTENHEGVAAGYLDRLVEKIAALDGSAPPTGLAPEAKEWTDVSCGVVSAYLFLKVHGKDVTLANLAQRLAGSGSREVSVLDLANTLENLGLPVKVYESDWEGLKAFDENAILHFEARGGRERHFVLGKFVPGGLRVVDPPNDIRLMTQSQFEELLEGKVRVISTISVLPEGEGALFSPGVSRALLFVGIFFFLLALASWILRRTGRV